MCDTALIVRAAVAGLFMATLAACGTEANVDAPTARVDTASDTLRVALFNIRELSADKIAAGALDGPGTDEQLMAAAEVIRRIRPDVLILNEIDHAAGDSSREGERVATARAFAERYLEVGGRDGVDPLHFDYAYAASNNTGLASGLDLNGDGTVAKGEDVGTREYGEDAFGFGEYPGQYSMAVLSRWPFDLETARTFQRFRWKDLPNHHMPSEFYSKAAEESLRLSSKSHWDLPIQLAGGRVRLLLSHPTPPVFDGDEDRNGRRNFDEIGFWAAYLEGSPWIYDDRGREGGYVGDDPFLIAGDLNARPNGTDGFYDGRASVMQLLSNPAIQDTGPMLTSAGALQGRSPGPPEYAERSTAVFGGGWRLDYLLPSVGMEVLDGGVFWPAEADDPEGWALAEVASDHRLVWLDLVVP